MIYTLFGDGKGGFTISHQEKLNYTDALLESLAVADINEDGIPDLVYEYSANPAAGPYNRIVVELGDGAGLFGHATGRTLPYYAPENSTSTLLVADYNRDGYMDVLDLNVIDSAVPSPRDSKLFYGSAAGALSEPLSLPLQSYAGAVINLNHDNAPDVVATTYDQVGIQRILNTGAK